MPTGACGIDCNVCGLNTRGVCSTCGAGTSRQAAAKAGAQQRLFGQVCPVLACARLKEVAYCLRDCELFPCENFTIGPYPFSGGFLNMQQRRREEAPVVRVPLGGRVQVPIEYWEELARRDPQLLCETALCRQETPGEFLLPVLAETFRVDVRHRRLQRVSDAEAPEGRPGFLDLLVLVYLLNVSASRERGEMIGVRDLRDASFFQGPHTLPTATLLQRFSEDLPGFEHAARHLGGLAVAMADAAFTFYPFPKIPLHFLLWAGDDEFGPQLSILFDRSIERHLAADAIWGMVHWVSETLLAAA